MQLTERESFMLNHITRWGSDGYPIQKLGRKWGWAYGPFPSHEDYHHAGQLFSTRKQAVTNFELHLEILRDKKAGRL